MGEYYLVDVKSISSKTPRSHFSEDELETLAQSILNAGGLLAEPLLLKQTGAESYEVLAGDRAYYAAVRAREINPRQAETVNAFVVPEKLTQAAIQHFSDFRIPPPPPPTNGIDQRLTNLESRLDRSLTNLESRLDRNLQEIRDTQQRELQRLEHQIQALQAQIPPKVEPVKPLEIFNSAASVELLQTLKSAGIKGKTATKLITAIETARAEKLFTSFSDIVKRVNGLGDKRMLAILDACNRLV